MAVHGSEVVFYVKQVAGNQSAVMAVGMAAADVIAQFGSGDLGQGIAFVREL